MFVIRRQQSVGFTLIEMAVALSIACILLALGAPAFSGYLQNARLGAMAQSIYGGLQTARAEAVKRNQPLGVEFVLTSSSMEAATADTIVPDATGKNWVVRQHLLATDPYSLVEMKSSNTNDVGGVSVAASSPSFIFNNFGGSTAGAATGIALDQPRAWRVRAGRTGALLERRRGARWPGSPLQPGLDSGLLRFARLLRPT